jgi:beta-phosphoglucomutase
MTSVVGLSFSDALDPGSERDDGRMTGPAARLGRVMAERVAFLFDMDGTIADTMPFHLRAWMDLLREIGVQMEAEDFLRKTSGKMNRQILREVLGMSLSDADAAAFEERKESLFRALCRPHVQPIAGLIPFLAESRRLGISMAVATAAGKANRDLVLNGLGVASHFTAVVGPEDVQCGKPHPEIFLKAAARLDVNPTQCLVFEDALSGIEAAGRAGMKAVALTTSLDAEEFQGHPPVIRIARDYTHLQPQTLMGAIGPRM